MTGAVHADCIEDCCWPALLEQAGGPTPIRPSALYELDRRGGLPRTADEAGVLLDRIERDASKTHIVRDMAGLFRQLVEAVGRQASATGGSWGSGATALNALRTATTELLDSGVPLSLVLETVPLPDCALKVPLTVYLGVEADVRDGHTYRECMERWGVGRGFVACVSRRHKAWAAVTGSDADGDLTA